MVIGTLLPFKANDSNGLQGQYERSYRAPLTKEWPTFIDSLHQSAQPISKFLGIEVNVTSTGDVFAPPDKRSS
jgi:hypothetical protein